MSLHPTFEGILHGIRITDVSEVDISHWNISNTPIIIDTTDCEVEFLPFPKHSQNIAISNWLNQGKTITAIQALNMFGCFRLSARILDLKKKGFAIETKMVYDNGKRYAEYSLKTK